MNRIRERRKSLDLTMKQLADMIGVSVGAVSHYETGRREPDPDTLKRISNALGVSVDYLLDNDSTNKPTQPVADQTEDDLIRQQILHELQALPDNALEQAMTYIQFLKATTKDGGKK